MCAKGQHTIVGFGWCIYMPPRPQPQHRIDRENKTQSVSNNAQQHKQQPPTSQITGSGQLQHAVTKVQSAHSEHILHTGAVKSRQSVNLCSCQLWAYLGCQHMASSNTVSQVSTSYCLNLLLLLLNAVACSCKGRQRPCRRKTSLKTSLAAPLIPKHIRTAAAKKCNMAPNCSCFCHTMAPPAARKRTTDSNWYLQQADTALLCLLVADTNCVAVCVVCTRCLLQVAR